MKNSRQHVVIHSLIFPPDQVSTSYLYGDITQRLIAEGYRVTVLTTFPHYNFEGDFKRSSDPGIIWRKTNYHGARVYHFPQKKSGSFLQRGFYVVAFHLAVFVKALFLSRFHYIITPSPPLSSGFIGGLVAKIRGARAIYNVQEIYPDVFIKQGAIKNDFLVKMMRWMEKMTYKLSDKVVTIDEHFSSILRSRIEQSKLTCIPNFIDTDLYQPYKGEYPVELKFEGKFVIGYVGNLGKVQDWEAIVDAASVLKNDPKYHFLLIGGGSEYQRLKRLEENSQNITVWPYQHRDKIPAINSRIDLHIISMNEASDYDGLPSKVFAILSSGRPILAATNNDTALANMIRNCGNGLVVKRSDSNAIAAAIRKISNGYLPDGSNEAGRQFVLNNYSKEVITSKYVQLLHQLT